MTPFEKLLVAHLVGDWILAQTDWEATNKAKHWGACFSHAAKWTAFMLLAIFWATGWQNEMTSAAYPAVYVMGILHALIDRRTPVLWLMRVKEYIPVGYPMMGGERREPPFWLVVCVDQVLHIVQVAILASLL